MRMLRQSSRLHVLSDRKDLGLPVFSSERCEISRCYGGMRGCMDREVFEERKKTIYSFLCDELYVPMKLKEIAVVLNIPKSQREELFDVLEALRQDGKIEVSSKGKYQKAEGNFITGVFIGNAKGFGFVEAEDGEDDIFIPQARTGGAFHGDTVQVVLAAEKSERGRRREGAVAHILRRGMTRLVCTYQKSSTYGFAIPDNSKFGSDIFIPQERSKGAVTGHKIVVEITDFGKDEKKPEGKVIEILGHMNDPGTDILSVVRAYELPMEFSEKILRQAERVAREVSTADMAGRMDLRGDLTVTIDGEDAKDLDDAISLTKEGDFYRLGVHIADVTNYVQEHSALDVEARKRGTSVYLVDRVIPMLPHTLSNGICSLNAGEDRLALSCLMTIDEKGRVTDHTIAETVVRVDRRMSYANVRKILEDQDAALTEEYHDFVSMFALMKELAEILRKTRMKRGSIDFDFPETKIILDPDGKPVEIRPYERNVATKIIEDFMLIANETVAQDYFWQELPFVYRVHDRPDTEKIRKLATFINNFGYTIRIGQEDVHPKELQKLLAKIDGTDEEALIARLTLRSMKQAKYATQSIGHFGLAANYYCHFTSPIRRYPDLQIHRIIKDNLRGRMNEQRMIHYEKLLPEVAKHSSETERRADEAERETEKLKKVEYMSDHLGEIFDGVISGVTESGFFVELPNTIEGRVHVNSLTDDYYYYDAERYELVGEASEKRYKLGQKVTVVVENADKFMRTIDFLIAEEVEQIGEDGEEADCK